MADEPFSYQELHACAVRELRQRRRVYPRLVEEGTMRASFADYQIALMEAICEHFERLVKTDAAKGDLFGGR